MDADFLGLRGPTKPLRQGVAAMACKVAFSSYKATLVV